MLDVNPGARVEVKYQDEKLTGTAAQVKGGWVLIDLDNPATVAEGRWRGRKFMARDSKVKVIE